MRISGYGTGSGGSGSRGDRREAFRRKHRPGQRVVGCFLRRQDDNLAWVEVDGQQLLAELGATPQPGQRLFFVIKQLEPDIVLQVLEGGGQAGHELGNLVQGLWGARIRFDSQFAAMLDPLREENSLEGRRDLFSGFLKQNPDAAAAFAALREAQEPVNAWLAAKNEGRLLLVPWMLPQARELEMLVAGSKEQGGALRQLRCTFALPRLGHCELRMLFRPPKGRFRLLLERPEHAACVRETLSGVLGTSLGLELEPGGVGTLPPGPRTVLAAFLAQEARRGLPRFSTHV